MGCQSTEHMIHSCNKVTDPAVRQTLIQKAFPNSRLHRSGQVSAAATTEAPGKVRMLRDGGVVEATDRTILVEVGGVQVQCIEDTGADRTVLSAALYQELQEKGANIQVDGERCKEFVLGDNSVTRSNKCCKLRLGLHSSTTGRKVWLSDVG